MKNNNGVGIIGTGSYVPEYILTNERLEQMVETTDEWIRTRTGIRERRYANKETATSDLAIEAAKRAIATAGIDPSMIGMLVVATVTPDMPFPSTACIVQEAIGARNAFAFDLGAACSGFVFALSLANDYLQQNPTRYALVIGAETLSKITDQDDRNTVVLFGDGAGAAVLGQKDQGGLLAFDLGSDGSGGSLLQVAAGGSRLPASKETVAGGLHYIRMNGKEVYKFAVRVMGESALRALAGAGLVGEDIDCLIPHQANIRIIEGASKRLKIGEEKVFVNLDRYGNMSAASIAVALDEAVRTGRIASGQVVVLVGFGAGLTWGSCVIKW